MRVSRSQALRQFSCAGVAAAGHAGGTPAVLLFCWPSGNCITTQRLQGGGEQSARYRRGGNCSPQYSRFQGNAREGSHTLYTHEFQPPGTALPKPQAQLQPEKQGLLWHIIAPPSPAPPAQQMIPHDTHNRSQAPCTRSRPSRRLGPRLLTCGSAPPRGWAGAAGASARPVLQGEGGGDI